MITQNGFKEAVAEITKACSDYFADRLMAIYISGSVCYGEAFEGESDLDYWGFVLDEISEADQLWLSGKEKMYEEQFGIFKGVHIGIKSLDYLKKDKFCSFILKNNSKLYQGYDVVGELYDSETDLLFPDKSVGKVRLGFARKCLNDALNGLCPACIDGIPDDTYFAARKFARYFVLVEGAYYLMSKGVFKSFEQEVVIGQLKKHTTGFEEILDLSLDVIKNPHGGIMNHWTYLEKVRLFTEWMFGAIEEA